MDLNTCQYLGVWIATNWQFYRACEFGVNLWLCNLIETIKNKIENMN